MFSNNLIAGAAGQSTGFYNFPLEQSLRFNDNDSAYLSYRFAAGNQKVWTFSAWVKRGNLTGSSQQLMARRNSTNSERLSLAFDSSDKLTFLSITGGTTVGDIQTNAVFRDPSAWYHVVYSFDAANTSLEIYVNGVEQSLNTTTSVSNVNHQFNALNAIAEIGRLPNAATAHFDGYLAEVHFTDGTAYDADAFGEFKSGVWVAKTPSVTYGTNGFYLDFANSADIGNDVSGEGNDWTPNNFTASDVVLDSPTDNFATLNPIQPVSSNNTFSEGNLQSTTNTSDKGNHFSTLGMTEGKYYAECTFVSDSGGPAAMIGISADQADVMITATSGIGNASGSIGYQDGGDLKDEGSNTSSWGNSYTTNDVIGIAYDADTGNVWFSKNGVWQASGDPDTSTSPAATLNDTSLPVFFAGGDQSNASSDTLLWNFGQSGFTYTPPTGYLALSTANLPEPTISPADDASPEDYFNTVLYTGTGASQDITTVGFVPDWLWIKSRSNATSHEMVDILRGNGVALASDLTSAEITSRPPNLTGTGLTDGFNLGGSNVGRSNENGYTYVAWNWKANGSGVSNTDGSITSTVSANTESGFSIVSWSDSTSGGTIGHGLSQAPELIIAKNRDITSNWRVGSNELTSWSYLLYLHLTNSEANDFITWDGTAPTSSVFSVGSNDLSGNGHNKIAYCFHSVEGFSKFGSYTGNGSTDGTFVYTGFRPAFVITKKSSSTGFWNMFDSTRDASNDASEKILYPNSSLAESTESNYADIVSNGFKLRSTSQNDSGQTFIYMAFAENPFKYSLAR